MFKKFFNKFKKIDEIEATTKVCSYKNEEPEKPLPVSNTIPQVPPIDKSEIDSLKKQIDRLKKQKSTVSKRKNYTLQDAIQKIISESDTELNATEIYTLLEKSRLRIKKSTLLSVKNTIYGLIKIKKIRKGSKRGTFTKI